MHLSDQEAEIERHIAIVTAARISWSEREQAVAWLIDQGEPSGRLIIRALEQNEGELGAGLLVGALGKLRDERAVPLLIAALQQESPHMRQDAATALGLIGDPQAIGPLINAFRAQSGDTEDITAWQYAATALARFGASAFDSLVGALSDGDSQVRSWSADALGQLGDVRAVEPLKHALSDDDTQVRIDAIQALGCIGDAGATDAVAACLNDPERLVRMYATRALGKLVKGVVFEPLVAALDDDDVDVRWGALFGLAESAGAAASELLLARVTDPDPCVRYAAVHALSIAGDERLIPRLRQIAEQDQGKCRAVVVREGALYAIGRIEERQRASRSMGAPSPEGDA